MNKKLETAIIIGSSKIAKIHQNYLKENKINNFFFVGRKKEKIEKFIKNNKIRNSLFINKNLINNIKSIISICNKTDFHQNYLDYLKPREQLLIVEKPLISVKVYESHYEKRIKYYYEKFKKLIVVYPMIFFAQSCNKYISNNKINNFHIHYYTKGDNKYDDIYIDLLPHCLIFLKEICRLKKKKLGSLKKINKKILKYDNTIDLIFSNVRFKIILKEKYKGKNSKFYFSIDKKKYFRTTKIINSDFTNFIKIKNKLVKLENPMRQFFFNTINNLNNKKYFIENKKISIWLSKMTYKIFSS